MSKLTLNSVANLQDTTTAQTTINTNNTSTVTAMENTLSRDGTTPNTMNSNLDMNSNHIVNLPPPASNLEPLRFQDLTDFIGGSIVVPANAAALSFTPNGSIVATNVQLAVQEVRDEAQPLDATLTALAGLNTTGGLVTQIGTDAFTKRTIIGATNGVHITNGDGIAGNPTLGLNSDLDALENLAGTGIASRTGASTWSTRSLTAPAAGLTITNPDGVSGNPTFALANDLAALEGLATSGYSRRTGTDTWVIDAPGQLIGTATNDSAASGFIGEFTSSTIATGSAVALTTGVTSNITSISLTAGDWDVQVQGFVKAAATTTVNITFVGPSLTSATLNTNVGQFAQLNTFNNVGSSFGNDPNLHCIPVRFSLASTTTIFFVMQVTFGVSTCSGYGIIRARRMR